MASTNMITIFTIPKPFTDPHIRIIQRNAIQNWIKLNPAVEVILLGDDEGVAENAREFGIKHIPEVKLSQWGTPLINSAFELVRTQATNDLMMYVNADIIFTKSLIETIKHVPSDKFLMIGRRQDLDITSPIDFSTSAWEQEIIGKAKANGKLHSPAGIDYFIFRKASYIELPPLIVGRVNWDSWMIWNARHVGLPIIDATKVILAIHQNHGYRVGHGYGERKVLPESAHNDSFIPDRKIELTISGANWIMQPDYGLTRNIRVYLYPIIRVLRKFKK